MTSPSRRVHVIPGDIMQVRIRQPQAAAAGNGLLNALIAYWPLNEASGNAIDAHTNGLDLTDTNTVTNDTGIVYATARKFTAANNEYFQKADDVFLSAGDTDLTVAAWVYLGDKTTYRCAVTKTWDGTAGTTEYVLGYYQASDRWWFRCRNGAPYYDQLADNLGSPSLNTWYLVVGWHDSVNNTINIQVNNGTVDSDAYSSGIDDTAQSFTIGRYGNDYFRWEGRIGPAMIWKSAGGAGGVLTAAQRTALYNSGAGLPYASFTT